MTEQTYTIRADVPVAADYGYPLNKWARDRTPLVVVGARGVDNPDADGEVLVAAASDRDGYSHFVVVAALEAVTAPQEPADIDDALSAARAEVERLEALQEARKASVEAFAADLYNNHYAPAYRDAGGRMTYGGEPSWERAREARKNAFRAVAVEVQRRLDAAAR